MGRRQMAIVLPHLVDNGGDLSKDWFVEYSVRDPYTGNMKRFREYSGFKKLKSAEERYELANTIIAKLRTKMEEGWSPFGREKVTYEDALLVQKYAERWGREKESVVTIRTHLSEFLLRKKTVLQKSLIKLIVQNFAYSANGLSNAGLMRYMWVSSARNMYVSSFVALLKMVT